MALSGAYNIWDELILDAEIAFFRSKYPEAKMTIMTYDPRSFVGEKEGIEYLSFFPNNIRKYPFQNIRHFLWQSFAISRHDLIVVGGGWIFFDNEAKIRMSKILFEWRTRLFFARLYDRKVCFFGISMEIAKEENLRFFRGFFQEEDTVLVRDERSRELLAEIGVQAEVIVDPVLLGKGVSNLLPKSPKKVGISLRGGFLLSQDQKSIQSIVSTLQKQWYEIVFLSHSLAGDIHHNDYDFVKMLFGDTYPITKTLTETLEAYKNIDVVVAMRLHSVILGMLHGIPTLPILYGPKVVSLVDKFDLRKYALETHEIDESLFFEKFSLLLNDYDFLQDKIVQNTTKMREKSLQKLEKMDMIGV